MPYKELSLIGDSIGQGYWDQSGIGWFGRLSQMIGAAYPYAFGFHNASMAGDTSLDALHRLSSEVQQRHADYVIIAVGTNDLARWRDHDTQTSLAIDTSISAWDKLLSRATKYFEKVSVIGCLPVHEINNQKVVGQVIRYRHTEEIEAYNTRVAELCAKYSVPNCNGLFAAMQNRADLFHDATHPNAAGHQLIAETVFGFLCDEGWFEM